MANYIQIISEFFPTAQVALSVQDPTVYANLVWTSTAIPQATLDTYDTKLSQPVYEANVNKFDPLSVIVPIINAGVTIITAGTPLYSFGVDALTDRITVVAAASNDNTRNTAIGVAVADIPASGAGIMITSGILYDVIDLTSYPGGTVLYLGSSGGLTNVKPTTAVQQKLAYVRNGKTTSYNGDVVVNIEKVTGLSTLSVNTAAPTPPPGDITVFAKDIGGRIMPAFKGPSGLDATIQAHLARNKIALWTASGNSTTITALNAAVLTTAGSVTTAATVVNGTTYTMMRRIEYLVTVAATNAIASIRYANAMWQIGHNTNASLGGFHYMCICGPATGVTNTSHRFYMGMANSTTAPSDVEPSTVTNSVGVGYDSADTNLQIMHRGAGAVTKINLGASFPVPTTDRSALYELVLFSPPGTTQIVNYTVTNLINNATVSGQITTNLPINILLAPRAWTSVGGVSSVVGLVFASLYIETD